MKRGTTAILLLAFVIGLATVSARAQGMGGGDHKHQKQTDKTEPQKPKADEKAYNAALKVSVATQSTSRSNGPGHE
jgi:hypothetical protein